MDKLSFNGINTTGNWAEKNICEKSCISSVGFSQVDPDVQKRNIHEIHFIVGNFLNYHMSSRNISRRSAKPFSRGQKAVVAVKLLI